MQYEIMTNLTIGIEYILTPIKKAVFDYVNPLTIANNPTTNAKGMNIVILVLVLVIFGIAGYTVFSNRK